MKRRIFIAINLSNEIRTIIGSLIRKLQKFSWPVKWESPEKLHISLRFLGDIEEGEIENICGIVKTVVGQTRPFNLTIKGFVGLPNFKFPHIIGLKISENRELITLHSLLVEPIDQQGIGKTDERPFTGHITIGRLTPTYAHFKALSTFSFETQFAVPSVELMESVLKPAGSEYTVLYSFQLIS